MNENDNVQVTSISKAQTLEEIGDYWDTHSLTEHWDETYEVEFEVRAQERHHVAIEPELYNRVEVQARQRGVQPETLINLWISERLQGATVLVH
ncbi:MAG: hypothetical protein ACOYNY_00155 [Caldilineaceae bacterium]|jgi:hypothetical protein